MLRKIVNHVNGLDESQMEGFLLFWSIAGTAVIMGILRLLGLV